MIARFSFLFFLLWISSNDAAEQLFRPRGRFFDKKFRLLVEDFVSKTDVEPQTQIDELLVGVSFANETGGNSQAFYSTAFTNLKRITPALETLNVDGGYVLKPAFGTADELRAEVEYLREHMSSLLRVAHEHRVEVPRLIVGVGWLFEPKIADEVNLRTLLARTFGGVPTKDPVLYEYVLSFAIEGVRCELAVTISSPQDTPTIPKGRTNFIAFTRLPKASMDTAARLYYNHVRFTGRFEP
ncbi:hypothetical protein M3Y99_00477300 [Aphelenchoides fujianensis]|nr:hypothetical protein M3Y99_00477300 [Aphelenchoides fujianensis]